MANTGRTGHSTDVQRRRLGTEFISGPGDGVSYHLERNLGGIEFHQSFFRAQIDRCLQHARNVHKGVLDVTHAGGTGHTFNGQADFLDVFICCPHFYSSNYRPAFSLNSSKPLNPLMRTVPPRCVPRVLCTIRKNEISFGGALT